MVVLEFRTNILSLENFKYLEKTLQLQSSDLWKIKHKTEFNSNRKKSIQKKFQRGEKTHVQHVELL